METYIHQGCRFHTMLEILAILDSHYKIFLKYTISPSAQSDKASNNKVCVITL